jgi:ubiquinone/menaquinone biosynthesis C-methylase UbiE
LSLYYKIKFKIAQIVKKVTFSPIKYWENRAKEHGEFSVLHLGHDKKEFEQVKEFQIQTIFPLLKAQLNGTETHLLDFGCGPGRFTVELAKLINGTALGVDPIEHLIKLAPEANNVSYKKIADSLIPAPNESFDVIWICLVLGGIVTDKKLKQTINELIRVSKKNTLLLLVENTSAQKDILSWKYRSKQTYINLLKKFNISHLKDYDDLGECISIFAGRIN